MTRYLLSDLHLGHDNIIDYCDRPFADVEEMNRTLVANWNEVVDPDDIVIYLGDLGCFADDAELRAWLDELDGRVIFVEGNHDRPDPYVDGLNTHQYYILERGDRQFCCVHRPANVPAFWDGWVVHGHHHNNHLSEYPFVHPDERRVNVSADVVGFTPLPEATLIGLVDRGEFIETVD